MQQGVKSFHCIMQQGEANLAAAFRIMQRGVKSSPTALWLPAASCSGESDLSAAFGSGESNLTAEWCNGESNLTAAWCSGESNLTSTLCSGESIWQRGVKSKNFGGLPGPLKGQSCKKSHMGDYYLLSTIQRSFFTFYDKNQKNLRQFLQWRKLEE